MYRSDQKAPLLNISDALGSDNPDQVAIATAGIDFINTLLAKNQDYGSSAWQSPLLTPNSSPREGILVRMSDKILRLQTLSKQPAALTSESFDDTMKDLGAYCLLYLAYPGANQQ